MSKIKRFLSALLVVVLTFSLCTVAFAAEDATTRSEVPTILIAGDGDPLYDANNKRLFRPSDILKMFSSDDSEEDDDGSDIYESMANVMKPFVMEGILFGEWDNYYDNLQKEIGEIFQDTMLDENGNVPNGSGISNARKNYMANCRKTDKKDKNGEYDLYDYRFWYDWRLDPVAVADDFNDYIKAVKAVTGKDKVAVVARCLGTTVVMAYIAKYGTDDISGLSMYGSVIMGAELISQPISGKFNVDGNAIVRTLGDFSDDLSIDPFVSATIDLLTKSGIFRLMSQAAKGELYYNLEKGVTSALALATFYTWPSYWATVSPEDYDDALVYVFGEEGSEKRTEYAGLIEKIEGYNDLVRVNIDDILQQIKDSGINVAVLSKYGYQLLPVCKSADAVADEFTSAAKSSLGATTSTIYDTLSDEYIASLGDKAKYVSPDKQIDASTCAFPDSTFFAKSSPHSYWNRYEDELMHIMATAPTQLTVNDVEGFSQFMVLDKQTDKLIEMTADNCDTENWKANDEEDNAQSLIGKLTAFSKSLLRWFTSLFNLLTEKLTK